MGKYVESYKEAVWDISNYLNSRTISGTIITGDMKSYLKTDTGFHTINAYVIQTIDTKYDFDFLNKFLRQGRPTSVLRSGIMNDILVADMSFSLSHQFPVNLNFGYYADSEQDIVDIFNLTEISTLYEWYFKDGRFWGSPDFLEFIEWYL